MYINPVSCRAQQSLKDRLVAQLLPPNKSLPVPINTQPPTCPLTRVTRQSHQLEDRGGHRRGGLPGGAALRRRGGGRRRLRGGHGPGPSADHQPRLAARGRRRRERQWAGRSSRPHSSFNYCAFFGKGESFLLWRFQWHRVPKLFNCLKRIFFICWDIWFLWIGLFKSLSRIRPAKYNSFSEYNSFSISKTVSGTQILFKTRLTCEHFL